MLLRLSPSAGGSQKTPNPNPGYLEARKAFRRNFGLPIERYQDNAALEQLKNAEP